MSEQILHNAEALRQELDWLQRCIDTRLKLYFELPSDYAKFSDVVPPEFTDANSNYARFVQDHGLKPMERLVLILALAPHLKPEVLDGFYAKNQTYDRNFTEFGGQRGKVHGGFLPTGETALFLCGGTNLRVRHLLHYIFSGDFLFARLNVLHLEVTEKHEPRWASCLQVSKEYLDFFLHGGILKPEFGPDFPARYLSTNLDWEDLVLPKRTMEAVLEIRDWLTHSHLLLDDHGLARRLAPGYKCLFFGPPGTGKTLTASLLGKVTGHDVYRIDLSLIISKYIGETEKNLAKVFDQAQNQNWILFFDEADALFGRRTEARSSNDRFANQEVAYLLQRIEDFPGVAILASNLKDNLDEAFSRRFQQMISFPLPGPEQRLQLWQQSFPSTMALAPDIDLDRVARDHEMSGGTMMNVIRYCALQAVKEQPATIRRQYLDYGIRRELEKEGKLLV